MAMPCIARFAAALLLSGALSLFAGLAVAGTADFEDLTLAPNSNYDGSDGLGGFASRGVQFANVYNQDFGTWSGFIYSNINDTTTPGFGSLPNAFPGTGAGGAGNYGVAFGYLDVNANDFQPFPFDPSDPAQLNQLPHFALPSGNHIGSVSVTNTTYSALAMLDGDSFSKQFGGPTGNDPDFLKITAYGTDSGGNLLPNSVDFYLGDYRFANNALDYVVNNWTPWDLSTLNAATHIYFNLSGSDAGRFGLNTPASFAIDNIQFIAAPEPSGLVLMLGAFVCVAVLRLRRPSTTSQITTPRSP
jgi:hypothetical protein